jgi:heat shock protein HslJ
MSSLTKFLPALSMAALAISGCAATSTGGGSAAATPTGPVWVAEDIGGRGIIDSSHVTLALDGKGRASGRSGCNHYSGQYRLSGRKLHITQVAGTMMACAPALMDQEKRFLDILARASAWRIEATGALIIFTPDGVSLRFFPEQRSSETLPG